MRCRNCLRFGHPTKSCTNLKICPHCALEYHFEEDDDICDNPVICSNCIINNIENKNHNAFEKCPVFLREKEIQTIVSLEKVERRIAIETYKQRHQSGQSSFSSVAKSNPNKQTSAPNNISHTLKNTPREIVNYNDIESHSGSSTTTNQVSTRSKTKTINILPRNTSRKIIQTMKRKNGKSNNENKSKQPKIKSNTDDNDTSESVSMDNDE